jgi:hypothetical protein
MRKHFLTGENSGDRYWANTMEKGEFNFECYSYLANLLRDNSPSQPQKLSIFDPYDGLN